MISTLIGGKQGHHLRKIEWLKDTGVSEGEGWNVAASYTYTIVKNFQSKV